MLSFTLKWNVRILSNEQNFVDKKNGGPMFLDPPVNYHFAQ